jgi:hypothetical protein
MAVTLNITNDEAKALTALLAGGVTMAALDDLGLVPLQVKLDRTFDVRLTAHKNALHRSEANKPVKVVDLGSNRNYIITTF